MPQRECACVMEELLAQYRRRQDALKDVLALITRVPQVRETISMIRSMTGYGRGAAQTPRCACVVEMRSLNHRYCEIAVKTRRGFAEVENRIRALEEIVDREEAIGPEQAARSVPVATSAPTSSPAPSHADGSLLSKWWFWAAIGGAAVAITAGVLIASGGDEAAKPMPGSDGMIVLTLTRAP